MTPEILTTFIGASVLLTLAPGPDNLYVLVQSALHGRKSGIIITLGLCTGLLVHTTAVALGVAAIFLVSATAFTGLKLAGAAYLLYLAWQAFRASASHIETGPGQEKPAASALYRRGILMNISNPKVAIFFLAFLPQFADPGAGNLSAQLLVLGIVFTGLALILFTGIAFMAGMISTWLTRSSKAQTLLNRMAALVFTALALRLATATR